MRTTLAGMRACLLSMSLTLAGCAATYAPVNKSVANIDESTGYRRLMMQNFDHIGETAVLLAFSGGGTRAAALSYGVMQELRDTQITSGGKEVSLLKEVDTISSVSGGSFTAAYYGVYRDRLFEDYERVFLKQNVQSTLIRKLFSPGYWFSSAFSGFDRTEMAIDYYDRTIFGGATFSDMAANGPPFVDINATDLTTGMRFTFSQELFDMLCSDLGEFKVARAVTASSAVPVAFPTIVLKNHANECDVSNTQSWALLSRDKERTETQEQLVENLRSYRDAEQRPYIHLVDGGISDNLGLRSMIDRLAGMEEARRSFLEDVTIKNVLVILVNAAVKPESFIEKTAKKPSAATTMSAFIDSQMKRYDKETIERMRTNIDRLQEQADERGAPLNLYFSEVTFDHVQQGETRTLLNSMPTTLELSHKEVDQLVAAGRLLLRNEPTFVAFKQKTNGRLTDGALSDDEICDLFQHPGCDKDL